MKNYLIRNVNLIIKLNHIIDSIRKDSIKHFLKYIEKQLRCKNYECSERTRTVHKMPNKFVSLPNEIVLQKITNK